MIGIIAQLMSLCKASSTDPEAVRGQIAVSLMSRDAHTAGGSDRLPPTAVVDRMGNVSCFNITSPVTPLSEIPVGPVVVPHPQQPPSHQPPLRNPTSAPAVVSLAASSPLPRESPILNLSQQQFAESLACSPSSALPGSASGASVGGGGNISPPQSSSTSAAQSPTAGSSSVPQSAASPSSQQQQSSRSGSSSSGSGNRRRSKNKNPSNNTQVCVELPEGYETRITEQGQVYFYHVSSGTSSWYHPGLSKDPPAPQVLGPLPYGWEQRFTPSGKPYFVDHNSRTTHFTDPRLIKWPSPSGPNRTRGGGSSSNSSSNSTSPQNHGAIGASGLSTSASAAVAVTVSSSGGVAVGRTRSTRTSSSGQSTAGTGSAVPANVSLTAAVGRSKSTTGEGGIEVLPKYKRDLNAKIKALRVELQLLQPRNGHCRIEVTRKEIFEV